MIVPCEWCGAWSGCDKCDDPAVRKMMDELDDPMNVAKGGHIHACCDEHELYWQDAHYWTEHEDCEPNGLGLPPETIEYWVSKGTRSESFTGRPDCECHRRKQALLKEQSNEH